MNFTIKIVTNKKEYKLEGLNERETQRTLANAYDDILALRQKVRFGDLEVEVRNFFLPKIRQKNKL